jgi:hypothetical protein
MNWCFQIQSFKWFRWKLTELGNIPVWWPFWSAISQVFFYGPDYHVIRSILKLIAHSNPILMCITEIFHCFIPLTNCLSQIRCVNQFDFMDYNNILWGKKTMQEHNDWQWKCNPMKSKKIVKWCILLYYG